MRYVAYFRVSTDRQGRSGLGLDAQRETVRQRLNGGSWTIISEFTEIETGTAKRDRPELQRALPHCRVMRARLIVANVSRLTRDPDFIGSLVKSGVEVEFCDLPNLEGPVGTFMLRQMLSVAEMEAGMISDRTKKALAAAKARDQKLGGDRGNLPAVSAKGREASIKRRKGDTDRRSNDLAPIIAELRSAGAVSLRDLVAGLKNKGVRTTRGGEWSAVQVKRIVDRISRNDLFAPLS